jgi:uncharacterized protein (TIGR03435 family)
MPNVLKITIVAAALLSLTIITAAQNQPLAFEVASIKPSKANANGSSGINSRNGRIDASNVTLKRCIMGAYEVGPNQIIGGPDWLDSERFEITAKAEEPVGVSVLNKMLQTLLTDRFKLVLHRETKQIDAYILESRNEAARIEKGDGKGATTNNGRGNIVAMNATMDRFAEILSRQMDRPVVNHTGYEGVFNLTLKWTPESTGTAKPDNGAAIEGPSIFTAIQEQLGLRLRAQKVAVDVIVIDHAEKPSEN